MYPGRIDEKRVFQIGNQIFTPDRHARFQNGVRPFNHDLDIEYFYLAVVLIPFGVAHPTDLDDRSFKGHFWKGIHTHTPPILRQPLPVIEATRLLLNRGAGLLWAMRVVRGMEKPRDPDFIRRNYYKCILAMGDALLIAWKRYHTAYTGRDTRLRRLMQEVHAIASLQLDDQYEKALQFKFRPDHDADLPMTHTDLQHLAYQWGAIFLMVEQWRTGQAWNTLTEYSHWEGLREPEQHGPANWPRNLVHNKRLGHWSLIYPRERLYRWLPGLLGLVDPPPLDWNEESVAFLEVWNRFN